MVAKARPSATRTCGPRIWWIGWVNRFKLSYSRICIARCRAFCLSGDRTPVFTIGATKPPAGYLDPERFEDYLQRIPIEGKFGQGKNGYRLNYIRAKRADTSFAWINSIFLAMNLLILLRIFFARGKRGVAAVVLSLLLIGQALFRHRDTRPSVVSRFGLSVGSV